MPNVGFAPTAARIAPTDEIKEKRWFGALLAIAVLLLWVAPASSSFWLDETGTYWVVKDGLANALSRSMRFPGQYPLYSVIAWAALAVGGSHEFALRLPSLIAMLAAAFLLYRLAARIFDPTAARIAALVFICSKDVVFAAADARPYALGLCMVTGSALMLLRWLDTDRRRYAAGYLILSALAVHAHYFFATALVVHGLYALYRVRKEGLIRLRALAGAWIAAGILMAPLGAKFLGLYETRTAHSFADPPLFGDLIRAMAPAVLAGSIVLGLLLAWLFASELEISGRWQRASGLMVAGWALAPPLFCYVVSISTGASIFIPRYYIAYTPALALLAGSLVGACSTGSARRLIAAAVVLGAVLGFGSTSHLEEDWRGATQAIRSVAAGSRLPVLFASGFVEASDPKAFQDPELRESLFAPLEMYPTGGAVIGLPFQLDKQSMPRAEAALSTALEHGNRFVFVGRGPGTSFEPWIRSRLEARGFRSESLGNFGNVGAFLFRADEPRSSGLPRH